MRGVQRRSVGDSAEQAMTLRTARLILTPLSPLDEADHARASGNSDDALRDTRAAELQWREHGFGPYDSRVAAEDSLRKPREVRASFAIERDEFRIEEQVGGERSRLGEEPGHVPPASATN